MLDLKVSCLAAGIFFDVFSFVLIANSYWICGDAGGGYRFIVLPCCAVMMPKHYLQIITACASSSVFKPKKVSHDGMCTFCWHRYLITLAIAEGIFLKGAIFILSCVNSIK